MKREEWQNKYGNLPGPSVNKSSCTCLKELKNVRKFFRMNFSLWGLHINRNLTDWDRKTKIKVKESNSLKLRTKNSFQSWVKLENTDRIWNSEIKGLLSITFTFNNNSETFYKKTLLFIFKLVIEAKEDGSKKCIKTLLRHLQELLLNFKIYIRTECQLQWILEINLNK